MSYSETLSKMIKECGLSLREISERCRANGQKVDPSYISKLQTGNQDPASEDVNRAIARACGQDPEILLYEAFMQKAPKMIKDFHSQLLDFFKSMTSFIIKQLIVDNDIAEVYEQNLMSLSDIDLIKLFQEQNLSNLVPPSPDNANDFIISEAMPDGKELGFNFSPQLNLIIKDDSMEPIIPKGSKLQLEKITSNISNGDIVGVLLKDKSHYIRRYVPIDNKVALIAENRNYETMTLNTDEFKISGRVKSYTKII